MANIGTMSVPPPIPSKPDATPPKKPNPTPMAIVFPEWIISESVFAGDCLSWVFFLATVIAVRVATRMRKTPKIKPKRRSSMIVASQAPKYAPGAVVITRIKPVL